MSAEATELHPQIQRTLDFFDAQVALTAKDVSILLDDTTTPSLANFYLQSLTRKGYLKREYVKGSGYTYSKK